MNFKVFDVIELQNGEKATIIEINKNTYKVQITDENGKVISIKAITENEINKVIYTKEQKGI